MTENYVILAVVFLGLILEIIYAYKLKQDKKRLDSIVNEFTQELSQTRNKMQDVLSRTRDEAEKILIASVDQYKAVTQDVQKLSKHTQQKLSETTEELLEWQASVMASELETQQTDLRHHANSAQERLKQATTKEVQNLSEHLSQTIIAAQKELQSEITQISQKVRDDLEIYARQEKEKIAQKSSEYVDAVSQTYLKKELSSQEKHQIILQLIDEIEA